MSIVIISEKSAFVQTMKAISYPAGNGDFFKNTVFTGNYAEDWSLRKIFRRFIWHDRIHARAMYKMAIKTFGTTVIPNVFLFD